MTWAKLDDLFPQHRKVRRLSDGAFRVHVTAICACAHDLTDGYLTVEDVEDLSGLKDPLVHVPELVSRGLWDPDEADGWLIHDYLDYNPSAEKVKGEREAKAERQRRWLEKRKASQSASSDTSDDASADGSRDASRDGSIDASGDGAPSPTRTRPDPTHITTSLSDADATDEARPDVDKVCQAMADSLATRGVKRRTITKAWRTAARLLLDRDGYTVEQVLWIIAWIERDDFWSTNILSLPKLREKFDQLVLKAKGARGLGKPGAEVVIDQWMQR